jgi:hypothetical protein
MHCRAWQSMAIQTAVIRLRLRAHIRRTLRRAGVSIHACCSPLLHLRGTGARLQQVL